jgi:hypothetical protein
MALVLTLINRHREFTDPLFAAHLIGDWICVRLSCRTQHCGQCERQEDVPFRMSLRAPGQRQGFTRALALLIQFLNRWQYHIADQVHSMQFLH